MGAWKNNNKARLGSVPARICALILLGGLSSGVFSQTPEDPHVISLFFKFNSSELNSRSREGLRDYLDNRGPERRYLLVQGFGCERGGFASALTAAEARSGSVQAILIQAGVTHDRYRIAPGGVMLGEPRDPHRRVVIRGYPDERSLEYALQRAKELARRINAAKDRRKQEAILVQYDKLMREKSTRSTSGNYWAVFAIVFLLLIVAILLFILLFRNRNRRGKAPREEQDRVKHRLTPAEAEELAAITGEEPIPVKPASVPEPVVEAKAIPAGNREIVDGPRAQAKPPTESVQAREARAASGKSPGTSLQESIRSKLNMASKKKSKSTSKTSAAKTSPKAAAKSNKPISIGRAVEKSFEEKSLSQLAKSPINALEGLTPRHARMLEEGFGIKTIEDLAQLKYFEIARAIVVLAKYE